MPLKGAGNTLTAQIFYSLACTIFWFFGINGPAVANSVFAPISRILTMENLDAFFKLVKICQTSSRIHFRTSLPTLAAVVLHFPL